MIQVFFEEKNITDEVGIIFCTATDSSGGEADSAEITFSDDGNTWSTWAPARGNKIKLKYECFDTGYMFLDNPILNAGTFTLSAISLPLAVKEKKSRSWRNVALLELIADVAATSGLTPKIYNIENYSYITVTQDDETDIAFLKRILEREGYSLKINDLRLIIYSEFFIEQTAPTATITPSQLSPGGYEFSNGDGLISSYTVKCSQFDGAIISFTATDAEVEGPAEELVEFVSNVAEAERFAKGYLRIKNKRKKIGSFKLPLAPEIAAGTVLKIADFGAINDGIYIVEKTTHDLVGCSTQLEIRRILSY